PPLRRPPMPASSVCARAYSMVSSARFSATIIRSPSSAARFLARSLALGSRPDAACSLAQSASLPSSHSPSRPSTHSSPPGRMSSHPLPPRLPAAASLVPGGRAPAIPLPLEPIGGGVAVFAAELDVGAAPRHVGGDGHRPGNACLGNDLCFLLVIARVQH